MKNSRNKKGFTLTELMVVLVIMAIIRRLQSHLLSITGGGQSFAKTKKMQKQSIWQRNQN